MPNVKKQAKRVPASGGTVSKSLAADIMDSAKDSGKLIRTAPRKKSPFRVAKRSAYVILNLAADKPENKMTPLEKMGMARNGISKNDLEALKKNIELGYEELAKALSVTRATLINKNSDEKFGATLSERIVGLADLYSYGYEVFEDRGRFNQWMGKPNKAIGGKAPLELIDNQFGREEVRNIIGRIDYGVYS